MGRYRQQNIIIREFDEVIIVLENRDTIWALPKRASTNIIFHRWFSPPLGTYPDWHKFRQKLYTNRNITLNDCYRWARQHEIQSQGTTRAPDYLNVQNTGAERIKTKTRNNR